MKNILFQPDMVRAILAGTKTQTRRGIDLTKLHEGINPATCEAPKYHPSPAGNYWFRDAEGNVAILKERFQAGDIVWVREAHKYVPTTAFACSTGVTQIINPNDPSEAAVFKADWSRAGLHGWRPSIHMHEWAARIFLRITDVRVERLQEISEDDAVAEGVERLSKPVPPDFWVDYSNPAGGVTSARMAYFTLWDAINGDGSFNGNPWVWRYAFDVLSTTGRNEAVERAIAEGRVAA